MIARRHNPGFTLVELMIALTITAILVALGMPTLVTFMRDGEIRATTESIANGLRIARIEAARRNLPVRFAMGGGGDPSWAVQQVSDNSLVQSYSRQEGGTNIRVSTQPAQAVSITFNELGRIRDAPAAGPPNLQQLDISSTIDSAARVLRIYVDEQRGLRICDPSPLLAAIVPKDPRAC